MSDTLRRTRQVPPRNCHIGSMAFDSAASGLEHNIPYRAWRRFMPAGADDWLRINLQTVERTLQVCSLPVSDESAQFFCARRLCRTFVQQPSSYASSSCNGLANSDDCWQLKCIGLIPRKVPRTLDAEPQSLVPDRSNLQTIATFCAGLVREAATGKRRRLRPGALVTQARRLGFRV